MSAAALFLAGSAMQAGGGLLNAWNAFTQGRAQSKLYKAQAGTYALNGQVLQAQYDFEQEQIEDDYMAKVAQITGSSVQAAAHAGLKMTGSVAENVSRSLEALENEKAITKYTARTNYLSARYGNQRNAANALYAAKTARTEGTADLIGGLLGTGGKALSSEAKYQEKWGNG